MSLIPIIHILSNINSEQVTDSNRYAYVKTVINGDLSPTALDQMQIFTDDNVVIVGTTAYWFYNANGQGTPTWDIDQVFLATKDLTIDEDFTKGWVRYNGGSGDAIGILPPQGTGFEQEQTFCRTVIYDGVFKMWYTAMDSLFKVRTGYATSPDGITWTRSGSNPIYENFTDFTVGVVRFQVIKDGSTYRALACGDGNVSNNGAVYLTSSDGISWTKQSDSLLLGTGIRFVHAIRKSGSTFSIYATTGTNSNYYTNGIATTLSVWSTTDFVTFNKIGDIHSKTEPQEAGIVGGSLFEYNGKYYYGFHYHKNQVKHNGNNGEPFTAIKILESNVPFHNLPTPQKVYPAYLKRYYPCYQADESQTPSERITGELPIVTNGPLTWSKMRYVQFDGTQNITYPEYVPNDPTKFAVKARVDQLLTGIHAIMKQSGSGTGAWTMYLNAGKLEVVLRDGSNVIKKHYQTVDQIAKPAGVYDENDHVSVGFIFDSGSLKLCFGASADQATTKIVDDAISQIYTGGNSVELGENSSNEMRSFCIFDEITEDQWLNEIDL